MTQRVEAAGRTAKKEGDFPFLYDYYRNIWKRGRL